MLKLTLIALGLLFIGSIADVPAMFLAVQGQIPLLFIFVAGFMADVIPDFFWYWLGGKIGIKRFEKLPLFKQDPKRMKLVEKALSRYGGVILFASKFVYAFGIPTQIVAGAHRYDLKKMFLANALGAASWLALLYYLARAISGVSIIEKYIRDAKLLFLLFLIIALSIHFLLGSPMKRLLDTKKN
jgi:membrane protein DedA with SNARE-associated domain